MACKYKYKNNWYSEEEVLNLLRKENSSFTTLYNNLLKELETGRGKEVFEQVKRDYKYKRDINQNKFSIDVGNMTYHFYKEGNKYFKSGQEIDENEFYSSYTLEEQQEEAIVTLLGLMAADKLDAKKDATLISKLKELWKQISDFVKSLLRQDGIKIDELPITTTLNDLAEIMAYGNNKIILPGYKVEYSTPLGNKYDTLEEVNNEIRGLADANKKENTLTVWRADSTDGNFIVPTSKREQLEYGLGIYFGDDKDTVVNNYQHSGNNLHEKQIHFNNNEIFDLDNINEDIANYVGEQLEKLGGIFSLLGKQFKKNPKQVFKNLENQIEGEYWIKAQNTINTALKEKGIKIIKVNPVDYNGNFYTVIDNNVFNANVEVDLSSVKLPVDNDFKGFLEKNKEYEQSKEIIEEWKKENNIQYDPEEVYSRGQGFYSSIGAYSNLELDLLLKNLIQHIQDNKKASENSLIKDSDKIIFGHPGIGKTHLKESGRKDIIDFDSDYKSKINKQFNLPEGFKARNDFQKSNKEEYQEAVRKLWVEAKNDAKRTGKKLFASDMILLREFSNDFDKVITMSKETFVNRAKQRNDYTPGLEGTEGWKNNLDKEIGKIDKSKVHSTDKYLSDLLDSSNYGFTISAFTKPIDKRLKHIEGTGDRVRFVIYPKSEHIKWAAPTDVYSGSVWDAHEKVSKDKKSELLGVSFTKAPALRNINEVSPNLADIIDNLSHVHNELGIELTTDNFRIEYDDNIDYSTKKLIDNINKILDDKYGKLVKPEIKLTNQKSVFLVYDEYGDDALNDIRIATFDTFEEAQKFADLKNSDEGYNDSYGGRYKVVKEKAGGKQPTQTKENTTSIESVKDKLNIQTDDSKNQYERDLKNYELASKGILPEYYSKYTDFDGLLPKKIAIFAHKNQATIWQNIEYDNILKPFIKEASQNQHGVKFWILKDSFTKDALESYKKPEELIENTKEYTSQALINLKVAALKEVARKYPRSLITSKVVPINPNMVNSNEIQYSKVGSKQDIEGFKDFVTQSSTTIKPEIQKLFNSNPELAKSVYESLGFNKNVDLSLNLLTTTERILNGTNKKLNYSSNDIITGEETLKEIKGNFNIKRDAGSRFDLYKGDTKIANFKIVTDENDFIIDDISTVRNIRRQGVITLLIRALSRSNEMKHGKTLKIRTNILKQDGKSLLDSLEKKGIGFYTTDDLFQISPTNLFAQITPQQKQQAQELYSSYLQTTNNPTIEGFKQWSNKQQQINELFDSNPELANAVYSALGSRTLENSRLENDIKELIKGRENIPSSIFLSYLIDNNLIPKIQEYITSISSRHGEWNPLYNRITLDFSPINTKSEKSALIAHELMHALSSKYITSYEAIRQPDFKEYIERVNKNEEIKGTGRKIEVVTLTKEQLDAFDNLVRIKEKVFNFIKAGKFIRNEKLEKADFGSLTYAFSDLDKKENIHEFISEVFSKPMLLDVLKQIPTEGNKSNLFKEFIKALKTILGFSNESIIEDILYYSEKAFINEALKESNTKKQQAKQLYQQYLESLNKPNTNPILQNNQQEQVKKFAELQERLNNKEFLEGAKNAYENSEGLKSFGTQEQYNDYIARVSLGIIKNPSSGEYNYTSKVKDIVYHNTDTLFEKFQSIPVAKFFTKSTLGGKKYRLPIVLNITNPKVFSEFTEDDEMTYGLAEMYNKNKEKDGIINGTEGETRTEYVVFEPEQIHLLGSKQDVEGFKGFVNNKKNEVVKESNNQSLQDGLQWLKQIMPDVEPLLVDGLIDNIANGKYDILNDVITLSEDFANKGVVKEEVFHRWWEKMIPNQTEVENILNEKIENREITKDCKNDFKATQGLTTTTNGTNWSIIEDLKGNSHKLGGIDLTIGEDGISFKNNNSDIKAQDGLLIPSDKNKTNNYDNEFLNNWYKNRQIQDSYIQEAFELDKPEYLKKIEKYPEVKVVDKIDNNPNITGQYNKEKNEIYLTKDAEDSTLTHEQNHYINDFESYMKTIHDNIVKNEIKPIEDITHNGVKKNYDYLSNSNEIHSRIMILREKAGFKPNEFINEEKLDNYLKTYKGDVSNIEDLLYLMKDKKSLLNMLNYMAYNSNNNTENNA